MGLERLAHSVDINLLETSSGSPDQMTRSARRPGARLPISPPRPIASAGRKVIIAIASPQLTPVAPGIF